MSFSHGGGGGTPSSPSWGVPHLVMVRGTLSSHDGGYPIQLWWGYQSTPRMGDMGFVGGGNVIQS